MPPAFEIILPIYDSLHGLEQTIASLSKQSDSGFAVLLSANHAETGSKLLELAERELSARAISFRRVQTPLKLNPIEHWNWSFAQTQADWLKLLLPGEALKPHYIARLRQRLSERPRAQIIRCDLEWQTDWGKEILTAPFTQTNLDRAALMNYFPAHIEWLAHTVNFAYGRAAWLGLGGFSPHTPGCAALNLNLMLILHYGLENVPDTLVSAEFDRGLTLNETASARVNFPLELWLILRQAKNYCRAGKIPWDQQWLFLKALMAGLRRR